MKSTSRLKKAKLLSLGILATGLTLSTAQAPLQAKQKDDNHYLQELRTCQAETEADERLACFDKVTGALVNAADSGDLTIVDREKVRDTRRKLFGFSIPDFGIFGGHDKDRKDEKEFEQLDTTIAKVRYGPRGSLILTTQEGAVWEISDAPTRLRSTRAGQKLEIRKGVLNSYFLRINGQSGVKGQRIG